MTVTKKSLFKDNGINSIGIGNAYATSISFLGRNGHSVSVNMETGKVTYTGTPDDAARGFWDAVETLYPHPPCECKKP